MLFKTNSAFQNVISIKIDLYCFTSLCEAPSNVLNILIKSFKASNTLCLNFYFKQEHNNTTEP